MLLQIIPVAQNHNKPKLLLFWDSMKIPPLTTIIFSFVIAEEAKVKKR
jgi:hypothetical protein